MKKLALAAALAASVAGPTHKPVPVDPAPLTRRHVELQPSAIAPPAAEAPPSPLPSPTPTPTPSLIETEASWYDYPPSNCYDKGKRTRVPQDIQIWVAHKTLPCGTLLEISGSVGTLTVPIFDRGPYIKGRDLDLSAEAFKRIAGPLSRGVARVSFRVVNQ